MRIAYFDTVAGISGDMTLGAFLSTGLITLDQLSDEIGKLGLSGVELQAHHTVRSGIDAVKLDVVIAGSYHHHRHLKDIHEIIDRSSLSNRVKENAKKIFLEVARAEAKVHNSTIEKIHFHEVGAIDSIVDIVGAAICLDVSGVEEVYSSPVRLGHGGFIHAEHGVLPLPGPAAVEILKGYPVELTEIPFELTTPTGAAIIKAMSSGILTTEQTRFEHIGYGAGSREFPHAANVLRLMIGEYVEMRGSDDLVVVETNIDDMNPEIYPYVIEQLLACGAHDAYLVPIIMKKGRPGVLLSALTKRSKVEDVVHVFLSETSTLGVRIHSVDRRKVARSQREIQTQFGAMKFKVVVRNGAQQLVPEYEECKRIAQKHHIALVEVYRILEREIMS
jgi:uncharacterized protein (TIGR00299 family) protein